MRRLHDCHGVVEATQRQLKGEGFAVLQNVRGRKRERSTGRIQEVRLCENEKGKHIPFRTVFKTDIEVLLLTLVL